MHTAYLPWLLLTDLLSHLLFVPTAITPGASSGSTDLLPAPGTATNWTASLVSDSGRDSDLIFRFDGRQAAKIPDWVVPQNLTDQFTIATWMKHGPSPGLRAEKETLLCNSDKTGESFVNTFHVKNIFFDISLGYKRCLGKL